MKITTRRNVSKRRGASLNARMKPAAMSASLQFVRKSVPTNATGHPSELWIRKCTGSAPARQTHQRLIGVSSNAAVRIEFGGQRTDVVAGGKRSARPTWTPA